jgi:hypothetical protein
LEETHGARPDAVKGEELRDIGGEVREGAVTGIEECAGRWSADSDAVEDGATILGVGHPPRIGTAVGQSAQRRAGGEIIADRTDMPSF